MRSLRQDTVSGAAELTATAASILREVAGQAPVESVEGLRSAISQVGERLVAAQPAMASLVTLVREVGAAVDGPGIGEARVAAASAAEAFEVGLSTRRGRIVPHVVRLLEGRGRVCTLSSSSTVRAGLLAAGERASGSGRPLRVLCFESRPLNEGRVLAETLARAGIDVEYAVDAAVHALVAGCGAAVIGADSIGDAGVVAKVGSWALAAAARDAGVPFHVLADETKLLPRDHPQHLHDDRPVEEVWRAASGVTVWNRYFELVPRSLVTSFVTESGVLRGDEIEARRPPRTPADGDPSKRTAAG